MLSLLLPLLMCSPLWASNIHQAIERSRISAEHLGLWIRGEDKSFMLNEDKLMVPASLSKIPTAAAAIAELGLGFQYETRVMYTGTLQKGVLKGDIYLVGDGDPSVVSETYWYLVNEFRRSGIQKIEGQLYVDDFKFDAIRFSVSRQSRRVDRAYDAPVGALSFNWNSVNIYVRPGEKSGDPAKIFADPENEFIEIKNYCKTGGRTNVSVERKSVQGKDILEVYGKIAPGSPELVFYKSVSTPELWAGYNFKAFLNQQGIEYKGDVKRRATPGGAIQAVSYKSKPLVEIVSDMSKFSNNYVAEMLTKTLSTQKPASLPSGVERIQKWLEKMGWKKGQYVFENPSGFTHDNKFRARDLGELLEKIQKDYSMAPEFTVSLPISGVDGTLKKRLGDMQGEVRAKTGFLNGTVGLAGYLEKNGKVYPFAFMYNGPAKNDAHAKTLFDDILRRF